MDREKYTNKTNEILTWLDVNDAGAMDSVIRTNIQAGMDSEDENLDRFWAAVRAVCGTLPVSPIRHGQPSSLAPEIQASVDNVVNRVTDAFVSLGDYELMLEVILPHGKTGGAYADMGVLAADFGKKVERTLKAALKDGRWDGKLNKNGLTGMTPPPVKEKEETQ
tara:strand:+ start:361 stop:855 length:495 start_codon:yes stop_codon:yes gene_type:complete